MTHIKARLAAPIFVLVAVTGCIDEEAPIVAQTDDVDLFATRVLDGLQARSIAENREYCGYIYATPTGQLIATGPRPGAEDYCDLPQPFPAVVASYHTHGSYSDIYDNEVPSVDDLTGDFDEKIDGYVSTPAGRIWHNDYSAQLTRQLCSVACVTADPNDDPEDAGFIPQTFTLQELKARFE